MTHKVLNECIRLARSHYRKHPQWGGFLHYSFVISGREIVETGINLSGSPPAQFGYHDRAKLHSEFVAYRKAKGLLKGAPFDLVNVRFNRSGNFKMCAPCETCRGWLGAVGCQRVWFTLDGGEWARTQVLE